MGPSRGPKILSTSWKEGIEFSQYSAESGLKNLSNKDNPTAVSELPKIIDSMWRAISSREVPLIAIAETRQKGSHRGKTEE